MERVNKGEKYWSIDKYGSIQEYLECGSTLNDYHYESLMYFHTEEEIRAMVDKLRAVLKGADVIEMPTEEEARLESGRRLDLSMACEDEWIEEAYLDGFADCLHWLKSKVK